MFRNRSVSIAIFLVFILLLAFPVMAQDERLPEAIASIAIPAVLVGLIGFNNRMTEGVKLYLKNGNLPFTPSAETRSFLVLLASIAIGIASAVFTPTSTDWLGANFAAYPMPAYVLTGFIVSTGGAFAQVAIYLLENFNRLKATGGTSPN